MSVADEVARRLRDVDARRVALLDELEALDPAWLEAHPIEGKWSILEIVEHLVLAETATLRTLDDPDYRPPPSPSLAQRLKYRIVMFVLASPTLKVKVPSRRMVPGGGRDLAELRREWDRSQERLRELAATLDDEALQRPAVRHGVAGPMSLEQAVRMLDVHLDRHAGQIRERVEMLEGG